MAFQFVLFRIIVQNRVFVRPNNSYKKHALNFVDILLIKSRKIAVYVNKI